MKTLSEHVRGVDGLLCLLTDHIDAALMDTAGPQLRVISQMAVGYDNIDLDAARERGIAVGNTPGVLTEATADLAFTLLLAGARRIVEGARYIREGKWETWEPETLLGADLSGATLGIIGLGRIGVAMAQRARGFNLRIIASDPVLADEEIRERGAEPVGLDFLLRNADFVTVHTPLTPETRHLIDAAALAKMKPAAVLVNSARGPIVDLVALEAALRDGEIAHAALDVTDPEPIAADHPLLIPAQRDDRAAYRQCQRAHAQSNGRNRGGQFAGGVARRASAARSEFELDVFVFQLYSHGDRLAAAQA